MLVISNFLTKEMDLNCSEVIAQVMIHHEVFTKDPFYFKEVIYILFSYLQNCISQGNFNQSCYLMAIDYVKQRMPNVSYTSAELEEITTHFDLVMKVLRQDKTLICTPNYAHIAQATTVANESFFALGQT